PGLPLREALAHAEDRRQARAPQGAELEAHRRGRVAEAPAALRAPDDAVACAGAREPVRADPARAGPRGRVTHVLARGPDRGGPEGRAHRRQGGEDGGDDQLAGLLRGLRGEPAREVPRLGQALVELPVARDDEATAAHRRASTPGSLRPSRYSREAPPPVETWSQRAARPACWTAATLSPPPTTVKPGQLAIAWATARVPAAKAGFSKRPIGPFHSTVCASESALAKRASDSGPMS